MALARQTPNAHVSLEGDWGSQTYLTVPAREVRCFTAALWRLSCELDDIAWGDQHDGIGIGFELKQPGAKWRSQLSPSPIAGQLCVHWEFTHLGMLEPIREVLAGTRDPARVFDPDLGQVRSVLTAGNADYASFAVAFRKLILAGGLHAMEVGVAPQADHTCTTVFVDDNRCIFVRLVTDLSTLDARIETFRDVRWLQIDLNEPERSRFAVVANAPIKQLSEATVERARRHGVTLVAQDHLAMLAGMHPLDPEVVWNACVPGLMQGP